MKVKELVERLQQFDPSASVVVAVGTYTKAHPVAYPEPFEVHPLANDNVAVFATLPEGFVVSHRK